MCDHSYASVCNFRFISFQTLDDKVLANGNGVVNIQLTRKASLASTGINATSNLLTKTKLSTLVVDCTRIISFTQSTNNDWKRRYDYCYL